MRFAKQAAERANGNCDGSWRLRLIQVKARAGERLEQSFATLLSRVLRLEERCM